MSQTERPTPDFEYGYTTVHEWDSESPISDTLVDLFEDVDEISLTEGELLYDVVDPDAMDQLFHDRCTEQSLSFEYQDCKVLVDGGGTIVVHPPFSPPE